MYLNGVCVLEVMFECSFRRSKKDIVRCNLSHCCHELPYARFPCYRAGAADSVRFIIGAVKEDGDELTYL